MANIAGEGPYRENVARFNGDSQARTMNMQADALRYQGATALADAAGAKTASDNSAVSTIFSGAAKTYSMSLLSKTGYDVGSSDGVGCR